MTLYFLYPPIEQTILMKGDTMKETYSKFCFIDAKRVVGIIEQPGGYVVLEGTTYDPESHKSIAQRITFSKEAIVALLVILKDWEK